MHIPPAENWHIPKRRRIYLMRHGEVSYFDEQGKPVRPDTVNLNLEGRKQAQAAAEVLRGVPLDRVVCSDLPRCVETAQLVLAGRGLSLQLEQAFREIQPGRLTSIPEDEIARAFLEAFSSSLTRASQFLGGETLGGMLDRVLPRFRAVLADPSWKQLLLVAHGGVNRAVLCEVLELDLIAFGRFEQDPACINILDIDDAGRGCVRLLNYTPSNPAKIGLELTTMEALFLEYRKGKRGLPEIAPTIAKNPSSTHEQ